jgi:5-methylcytosine-specific restriction endonuclease McrA
MSPPLRAVCRARIGHGGQPLIAPEIALSRRQSQLQGYSFQAMTDDSSDSPYRKAHHHQARKVPKRHASTGAPVKPKRSTSGRRRRKKQGTAKTERSQHTSHPTTRSAQLTTRAWLLKEYGPTCAYCGGRFTARKMTLDHVAPRRGQTAYDRRDNLVLACGPCNVAKKDQSPLAYLLGLRSRAANLVKFGAHLSEGLIEMARSLVRSQAAPSSPRNTIDYSKWGPVDSDDDSPYRS